MKTRSLAKLRAENEKLTAENVGLATAITGLTVAQKEHQARADALRQVIDTENAIRNEDGKRERKQHYDDSVTLQKERVVARAKFAGDVAKAAHELAKGAAMLADSAIGVAALRLLRCAESSRTAHEAELLQYRGS